MLSEETRRKLREMNFGELVEALDLQEKQPEYLALTFDDRMNIAVDYTYTAKYNAKVHRLLILDEWLLNDMTESEQHFIFELIERRYDCTSTIFCTQYKREEWHSRPGGGIHADAILDRIVHTAAWVYSGDINMRKLQAKEAEA